ncbi:MAG: S8/S53 family peptidase [Bacteroidia bacterium]|nr:S8/S53 family peptidase [Bacteroidia bacterium]
MSRYFRIFLLFPLLLSLSQAQTLGYYTFEEKKPIYETRSSLSVYFQGAYSWQKIMNTSHPLIEEVHGKKQGATPRIIIRLKEPSEQSLEKLIQEFFPNPEMVKDASWGFEINEYLPVWLSEQILFEPGDSWEDIRVKEILDKYTDAKIGQDEVGLYFIEVSKLMHSLDLANELFESGMVNWAHPNFMAKPVLYHTPSDPKFSEQYTLHNTGQTVDGQTGTVDMDIDAVEAWDITLGDDWVIVGMVDEGAEPHEDMKDPSDNSDRVLSGFSPAGTGNGEPQFSYEGHGVSISGVIASTHNNLGAAGLAPNSRILPVYVEADPSTLLGYVATGMEWIWNQGKAHIINNSWGYPSCDPNLFPAIISAIDNAQTLGRNGKGAIVIFASGKNDPGRTCVNFPGNNPIVFTVNSITKTGDLPPYCPFGPEVDVCVPVSDDQSDIRTIDRMGALGFTTGNYVDEAGGTSSACGFASGIAALIISVDSNLTDVAVKSILTSTAIDMGSPGLNDSTGYGRLNAFDALSAAMGGFPVEWLEFTGKIEENKAHLYWATALENNNAYFEIQRSQGGAFEKIGKVAGAGNSTNIQDYTFTDPSPFPLKNYYRLKQVDQNGAFSYSEVLELKQAPADRYFINSLYPNPAKDQAKLEYFIPLHKQAKLEIVDVQGRKILEESLRGAADIQTKVINLNDWNSGLYFLILRTQKGISSSKSFHILP